MRRTRNVIRCGAAALIAGAGMALPTFAGVPIGTYDLELVAITDGDFSFVELMGGSMNNDGEIVFSAMTSSGDIGLYRYNGAVSPLVTTVDGFASAMEPSLADGGRVAFTGSNASASGIWIFDPGALGSPFTQIIDSTGLIGSGQSALNNAGDLAFWTLECVNGCSNLKHAISRQLSGDALEEIAMATAGIGGSDTVVFPSISADGHVAYRQVDSTGTLSSIMLADVNVSPDAGAFISIVLEVTAGILSGPSLNDSLIVAALAADDTHDIGIYAVDAADVGLPTNRVVALDDVLAPSIFTAPKLNNNGRIAFSAMLGSDEGIFVALTTDEDAAIHQLVSATDDPLGFEVNGAFEVLDVNDNGNVLFKVGLADGRTMIAVGIFTEPLDPCPGDLNNDGTVNVSDMLILLGAWGPCANPADCPADLNNDGTVNVSDMLILLANWGACPPPPNPCPPDLNGDGVVNVSDLLILLGAWGACVDPSDCPADLNNDGVVNVSDLLILLGAWGPCP